MNLFVVVCLAFFASNTIPRMAGVQILMICMDGDRRKEEEVV